LPELYRNGRGAPILRSARAALPAALSPGPDSLGTLRALRRRWLTVLSAGTLLALAAAAAAWFLLAPKYTAFALIHVDSKQPWTVFPTPESRNDFVTYLRTQATRIKTRYVLQAALNTDEVKKLDLFGREANPVLWLEEAIKVDFKEGSEFITISMSGTDPEELITLVNAVARAYLKEIVSVENKKRDELLHKTEALYYSNREKLRKSRDELVRLAKQFGTSDSKTLTQMQLLTMTTFGKLKDQYLQAKYELMKAQGRLKAYKAHAPTDDQPVPEAIVNQALQADSLAKHHLSRITSLKAVVEDYEQNAVRGVEESGARRARQGLQEAEKALEARRQELRAELTKHRGEQGKSQWQADLEQLEAEVGPLAEQEAWLSKEVERLDREAGKIGNTHTELDQLREDIKQQEGLTEKIGNQLAAMQVEMDSPNRVTLDQEAALQQRDPKRQLLGVALAPVAAFVGVGFIVSWWEARARRIQSVQEVTAGLGMRVMGAVPVLPHGARRRLIEAADKPELYGPNFLESIDAVRTLLLRDASSDGTKVVMVTSAVEGEGKTTLASHLAGSLARAGRKTLLIDCDLRRPMLQQSFQLPLQPGFSEVLLGQISPAEAIQKTGIAGLGVLTAGQWDRAVLQVLAKEGVQKLFDQLRPDFDFIIIDSHPVLAATDSLLIGQYVDAVMLSLLRDRSQAHVVYAACQRLGDLGIRLLGAVVNGIRRSELYEAGYSYAAAPRRI
jgi:capsular exopolysaccharide synthesis family protein